MLDKPMVNEYENIYIVPVLFSFVEVITFENILLCQYFTLHDDKMPFRAKSGSSAKFL